MNRHIAPEALLALMLGAFVATPAAAGSFGNYDGQFRLAHDVAVARDGAVYVADAWGQRVQKFNCRR